MRHAEARVLFASSRNSESIPPSFIACITRDAGLLLTRLSSHIYFYSRSTKGGVPGSVALLVVRGSTQQQRGAGSTSGRGGTAARAVAVACLQASGRSEAAKRRQLPRSSSGRRKRRQRQKWLDARRSSDGSSGERYAAVHQSRTVGSRWRRRRHPSSSQSKQQSTISSENSAHALNVVLGALPLSFWLLWQWQRVLTAAVSVVVHLLHVQWQQLAS